MCLAVPMKLTKKEGDFGIVELGGVKKKIGLQLMPQAKLGDYLIIHAGFALQILDEKEAKETIKLIDEWTRI